MKQCFYALTLLLAGCAADPQTGRTGLEEFSYQWECAKGLCPPPKGASYETQLEYARIKAQIDANEIDKARLTQESRSARQSFSTNCTTIGSTTHCNSY